MPTLTVYDHTPTLLGEGAILDTNDFYVTLLDNTATIVSSHTSMTSVTDTGADEVYGNGWTQGGVALATVAVGVYDTNKWNLDAADIEQAITGGNLGPFLHYVVSMDDGATHVPLFAVTLDADTTVLQNNLAVIEWDASGVLVLAPGA